MNILLIGSGARECALAWKISQSSLLNKLFVWPGNAMSISYGETTGLDKNASQENLINWAKKNEITAVICGPEQPLTEGLANNFQNNEIPVFGPVKEAAELEGSKAFSKEVMKSAGIPTAEYHVVNSREECETVALDMLSRTGGTVLKASGLAGGKGVFVCVSKDQVIEGLNRLFGQMSKASETVVVEEILVGRECSFFTFLGDNGDSPLGFAVDFKRLENGDEGPNTGGMGCYTPVEWLPSDAEEIVNKAVVWPLLEELKKRKISYRGCLYVGLMWGENGPSVVEFNVRLGDPECQVLSVADERDWLQLICEKLGVVEVKSQQGAWNKSVCVVMASKTYPYGEGEEEYSVLSNDSLKPEDGQVFGASVQAEGGNIKTGKGRVLSVVAKADSLAGAREKVYAQVNKIKTSWPTAQVRTDIAELASSEEAK
jgi:phosphoribosylamine--glycine ligase